MAGVVDDPWRGGVGERQPVRAEVRIARLPEQPQSTEFQLGPTLELENEGRREITDTIRKRWQKKNAKLWYEKTTKNGGETAVRKKMIRCDVTKRWTRATETWAIGTALKT